MPVSFQIRQGEGGVEGKLERSTGYEMLGGKEEDGCVRPFC